MAGSHSAPRRVPKGRLKESIGWHVQSSLRDANGIDDVPDVETPSYSREVPSGHRSSNRANFRQVWECAGIAQRRRRFRTQSQSGVALRLPPQSKKPVRGQPCPRETKSRHPRTKLSALLLVVVAITTVSVLLLCPASAHAQDGVPLWTNRFEVGAGGPAAMAVDTTGNVFVTGYSSTDSSRGSLADDYATVAYSNSGVPLWTNFYNGPANGPDRAEAIAVDGSGNVFVTGESSSSSVDFAGDYATIKYSGNGVPLWTNRYHGTGNSRAKAIAVDSRGTVFVTGLSRSGSDFISDDYVTIAYSGSGVPLWTNRYDGATGHDEAIGIAVDTSGNVFVTGVSFEEATFDGNFEDFATVAYSNAGVPLWTSRYDGAQMSDEAGAMAVDTSGNVFVTGRSFADVSNPFKSDYATVAYSNSGEPLWTNQYDRSGGYEWPRAIAVDSSGNVFVTGDSTGANDFYWATVAYSSAGFKLWTRLYNPILGGAGGSSHAIAVDRLGNVFVTGQSGSGGATVAYSNSGLPLWTNRVGNVSLSKMTVDRGGNVFVTGYAPLSSGATNSYVTIKYSSSIPLPHLDFQKLNNELVLSWTNAGFNLQTAPTVTGPFTNILGATSPYTNVTTSAQQFFRLIGN